eukprot:TRINITY_DN6748_c0_g1_i1.p1 TRINITY_DN6748_c0_g1~~TRINITY_DN6748_c0_g1_i1.p1  ORF type:complete len:436 (+),score=56.01 TRINITY_DN6748_c0_g1_i1:890-2197(+)
MNAKFLKSLPSDQVLALYQDKWASLSVFRSFPELTRLYILQHVFSPVVEQDGWTTTEHYSKQRKIIRSLRKLHVLIPKGDSHLQLHPSFRVHLKEFLSTGGTVRECDSGNPSDSNAEIVTIPAATLLAYTAKIWGSILHFMVGLISDKPPSRFVLKLLVTADLMQFGEDNALKITNKGFSFLFESTNKQVWTLLEIYLRSSSQSSDMKLAEILTFLFRFSFLESGKGYPLSGLTPSQIQVVRDLCDLGLVFRKKKQPLYFPTSFAVQLSSGATITPASSREWIIVETDYRIFAYTSSLLDIMLISLFTDLVYQLPNLVVGVLSQESVHAAFASGLSAQHILDFIERNAHPEMKKKSPVIPETVADDIRLWEAERNKVSFAEGVLFTKFASHVLFNKSEAYAKQLGGLIYSNKSKRVIFVKGDIHKELKRFIKSDK